MVGRAGIPNSSPPPLIRISTKIQYGYGYGFTGHKLKYTEYGAEWTEGDTMSGILDLDAGTISFSKNGVQSNPLEPVVSQLRAPRPHLPRRRHRTHGQHK